MKIRCEESDAPFVIEAARAFDFVFGSPRWDDVDRCVRCVIDRAVLADGADVQRAEARVIEAGRRAIALHRPPSVNPPRYAL